MARTGQDSQEIRAATGASPILLHRRVLGAALAGTAVEFYDFYIYVTASALVLGPLFFPAASREAQLLAAFLSFGLAFLARPLGAIAFGHFGDRVGRKATLVASLLLMGGSTMAIGLLPTYAALGWAAPLLLCLLRFGQGFGLGGEWGGAILLAVEHAPPGWAARFGAAPQLGSPIGLLAANGLFLLIGLVLGDEQFLAWGWRLPFLLSAVLVAIGLWIRLKLGETPAFAAALEAAPPPPLPLGVLLRDHWRVLALGVMGSLASFAIFYLATAFTLAWATGSQGLSKSAVLTAQLGSYLFYALGIVVAAIRADATSPAATIRLGGLLAALLGLGFGTALGVGSVAVIFALSSAALFVMGLVYGPLSAWLTGLFPVRVRYTGVSVAVALAGILGGALTPFAAQIVAGRVGVWPVGLLMSLAGGLTWLGVTLAERRASPNRPS